MKTLRLLFVSSALLFAAGCTSVYKNSDVVDGTRYIKPPTNYGQSIHPRGCVDYRWPPARRRVDSNFILSR